MNSLCIDQEHAVPPALRQHFRKSYWGFCEILEVCLPVFDELRLERVPHWTTLYEFSKRADTRRHSSLLGFLHEARLRAIYLAVDSRGFSSASAST